MHPRHACTLRACLPPSQPLELAHVLLVLGHVDYELGDGLLTDMKVVLKLCDAMSAMKISCSNEALAEEHDVSWDDRQGV